MSSKTVASRDAQCDDHKKEKEQNHGKREAVNSYWAREHWTIRSSEVIVFTERFDWWRCSRSINQEHLVCS